MSIEFRASLRGIPLYPVAETYDFGGTLVKLASNETPWPPHPAVIRAIEASLGDLNRYPDPTNQMLRERLAERHDLSPDRIAVGNGSCDILLAAGEALLEPGAEVVYAWPSFSMYPNLAAATGATEIRVPLDAAGRHDLEAMAREVTVATRMVIVCNPNNPTATALPVEQIGEFVAALPRHVAVVLDEAYVEFNLSQDPEESLELLKRNPNLILLRTFSKVYGLCGLRAGYALGSVGFRAAVDRVRQPFSVNMLAQAAAAEALRHQDEVQSRVERTVAARIEIEQGLDSLGLDYTESQANFAWIALGDHDEDEVVSGLAERGVIVRAGTHLGDPGHLRVTYGTTAENERFLQAMREVLAPAP